MDAQTTTTPQATNRDNLRHAGCRYCFTPPALGETVTALCGTQVHYLGHSHGLDTAQDCAMCAMVDAQVVEDGACRRCP